MPDNRKERINTLISELRDLLILSDQTESDIDYLICNGKKLDMKEDCSVNFKKVVTEINANPEALDLVIVYRTPDDYFRENLYTN